MERRERGYIIIIVVLLVLLTAKSFLLDPVRLTEPDEIMFANWIEMGLEEKFDGPLYKYGILKDRLVKVATKEEDEEIVFVGKIRRYLFGVLPVKELYIKENVELFQQDISGGEND